MGPRKSKRARTLKNDATSANDTHIEKTGRAGDRERQVIREWLAYPETTFNKKKAAELLPDIEIWAQSNCSGWKSLEFNVSMIGMILQSAAEDGRLSKHKPKNNRPTQWTCTRGPEPKGRISMDTRTFTSLVNYRNEAKRMDSMKKRAESEGPPKAGLRARTNSANLRLHFREALVLSGSSERKFPLVAFLIARAVIKELKLDNYASDQQILEVIPTNMPQLLNGLQRVDELLLTQDLEKKADCVFSINDAGNNGKHKLTYRLLVGYDHIDNCIFCNLGGADEIDGGGDNIGKAVIGDLKLYREPDIKGSCTDSASDVISGFVKYMEPRYPGFIGVGCTLHIMNLVLVNAYVAAFGDEDMEKNSALRLGFLVSYLQNKFPEHWKNFCEENPQYDINYKCAAAVKTRWWSVMKSFGDILKNLGAYSEWSKELREDCAAKNNNYFDPSDKLSVWIRNPKVQADLAFVHCFCRWFWNGEMTFLQGIGPWQLGKHELFPDMDAVPAKKQRAGYRADEYTIRAVLMHEKLKELECETKTSIFFEDFRVQ